MSGIPFAAAHRIRRAPRAGPGGGGGDPGGPRAARGRPPFSLPSPPGSRAPGRPNTDTAAPLRRPDVSHARKRPGPAAPQFPFLRAKKGVCGNEASVHTPPPPSARAWLPARPAASVTRGGKAPLGAGRRGLLRAGRRGLHRRRRRRLGVRGPEARSGAGQRGAAPPLRGARAQQRRLELHGPLQRRPARHAADRPGTRGGRAGAAARRAAPQPRERTAEPAPMAPPAAGSGAGPAPVTSRTRPPPGRGGKAGRGPPRVVRERRPGPGDPCCRDGTAQAESAVTRQPGEGPHPRLRPSRSPIPPTPSPAGAPGWPLRLSHLRGSGMGEGTARRGLRRARGGRCPQVLRPPLI